MPERDPVTGRFVRPVLHRQIDEATAEWLQLTAPQPTPRDELRAVWLLVALLAVVVVAGLALVVR